MNLLRKQVGIWAAAFLLLGGSGVFSPAVRGEDEGKKGAEAPVVVDDAAREEAKYEKITEFLLSEYARIGQSSDWLTRSLTAISTSRLPQSRANRALLKILKEDTSPAVQLVAWECLLARAQTVDPEQFETWMQLTQALAAKGVFNGRLRVDLLKLMAIKAPDSAAKKLFGKIFEETNSLRSEDIPVIEELGHTLAAWKSPDLVAALIESMKNLNSAYRAELVLKTAGCPVAWAGNRSDEASDKMWAAAIKDYNAWWNTDKDNWKEKTGKVDGVPWREMTSGLLTVSLFDRDAVKANNPEIRKDLELGNPGLRAFDVMFCVDATESMRPPMDWLKDDLRKMMQVMSMMSSQPRIGVTFYRDYFKWPSKAGPGKYEFVAKVYPLTTNVDALVKVMEQTKAMGGGDDPEAVSEGLAEAYKNGGWDVGKGGVVDLTPAPGEKATTIPAVKAGGDPAIDPKVIVLIGDAPPHPGTEKDCVATVKKAAEQGFKVYTVKLTTPLGEDKGVLPSFDEIAAAGNGASFSANFAAYNLEFRGVVPEKKGNIGYVEIGRSASESAPSKELLTRILLDSVNQKYRERIEMVVPILLEMCDRPVPEVRKAFKAAAAVPPPEKGPKQPKVPVVKKQQE